MGLAIPSVTTPRLRLRGFTARDLDAWAAILADEEVMRYIGAGGAVDRAVAWRFLSAYLGQWALRGYGVWAIERRSDGALIGSTGILHPEGWPGIELSYLTARSSWGQGLAFEAAHAARSWARDALGLTGLISLIRPENGRSIRLAEKLGATEEKRIEFMGGTAAVFRHPNE